ncbi:MAG: nucleoside phosphorylase [Promethearchaeota archaeon]
MEHIEINKTQCKIAILVGSPARVDVVCNYFGENNRISAHRGFVISETRVGNIDVLVVCTGIGCPSLAIVVEELCMIGIKHFIRIGTCGAIKEELPPGSIILSKGAIREEGTSSQYVDLSFPAVADIELIHIFSQYLIQYKHRFCCGITHTKDSFYSEKLELQLSPNTQKEQWLKWKKAGILATDMETSCLYVVSCLRGVRACSIMVSVGEEKSDERIKKGLDFILDSFSQCIEEIFALPSLSPEKHTVSELTSFLE